jgi:hypothetical protein
MDLNDKQNDKILPNESSHNDSVDEPTNTYGI